MTTQVPLTKPHNKVRLVYWSIAIIVFLIVVAGVVGYSYYNRWRTSTDLQYPGSTQLADHHTERLYPPVLRESKMFVSQDKIPDIHQWYSRKFDLGPERHAMGNCIDLFGIQTERWVERSVHVSLCETQRGQLISVSRNFYRP